MLSALLLQNNAQFLLSLTERDPTKVACVHRFNYAYRGCYVPASRIFEKHILLKVDAHMSQTPQELAQVYRFQQEMINDRLAERLAGMHTTLDEKENFDLLTRMQWDLAGYLALKPPSS